MRAARVRASLVLSLLLTAPPVLAQIPCEDDPAQEVANCSFETGPLDGWTLGAGDSLSASATSRSGSVAAGIDALEDSPMTFLANVESDCFPAAFAPGYGFGGYFRPETGSPSFCLAQLFWYPDSSCTVPTDSQQSAPVVPVTSAWTLAFGSATPTGSHGRLFFECFSSSTDFSILVDDAFAGPGLTTPVSLQSFTID